MTGGESSAMRIDDLAREVGLSVRNVRSFNERGLLPSPEVRGRVGYYGVAHVERIRLIQSLQAEGMKLDGVKRLLDRAASSDSAGIRLVRQAATAHAQDSGEIISAAELATRFAVSEEDARSALEVALRLQLLVPVGDGQFEAPSSQLIDAAEQIVRTGMALPTALVVVERLAERAQEMAHVVVAAFVEEVWGPFASAGLPGDGWSQLATAIDDSRPLAARVVEAVFRLKLDEEIEQMIATVGQRLSEEDGG